jgi:hypothetical protein
MSEFDPQADHGGGGTPDEGVHVYQVTECEVKTSSSGNRMCQVKLKVLATIDEESRIDTNPPCRGCEARDWLVYTRRGNAKMARFCRAIDPQMAKFDRNNQGQVDDRLLGRLLVATTRHEENRWIGQDGEERVGKQARLNYYRALKDWELGAVEDAGIPELGESDDLDPETSGNEWGDDEIPF